MRHNNIMRQKLQNWLLFLRFPAKKKRLSPPQVLEPINPENFNEKRAAVLRNFSASIS